MPKLILARNWKFSPPLLSWRDTNPSPSACMEKAMNPQHGHGEECSVVAVQLDHPIPRLRDS